MPRHRITHAGEVFYGAGDAPNKAQGGIPVRFPVVFQVTPVAAVANGVCASQALSTGVNGLINGSLASGGVATFDTPRNVVAAWTGAAVLTVEGTDAYGQRQVESSASGTSFAGLKAFRTITRVTVSANVTGLTVGNGDVLGLPVAALRGGLISARSGDNTADAGVFVPAVTAAQTATNGDVRGTYDPAVALNGSNLVTVVYLPLNPDTQEGCYGNVPFAG